MRTLPTLLDWHPEAHVIVVGADDVSYGSRRSDGRSWREALVSRKSGRR